MERIKENHELEYLFKNDTYSYENEFKILLNKEGQEKDAFADDTADILDNKEIFPMIHATVKDIQDSKKNLKVEYSYLILGPLAHDIDYIAPYILFSQIQHSIPVDERIKIRNSHIKYRENQFL